MPTPVLPNPTACGQGRPAPSGEHRNVFCGSYARCLHTAVKANWSDWTCTACSLFTATPAPSATRFAEDRKDRW